MKQMLTPNMQSRVTFAEFFPEAVAELLATPEGPIEIIFREGQSTTVAPSVTYDGITYLAPELPREVRSAIRFPLRAESYCTVPALFWQTAEIFVRYSGLSVAHAAEATARVFASWIAERFDRPIISPIVGVSAAETMMIAGSFCRRPLFSSKIKHQALFLGVRPTLLTMAVDDIAMAQQLSCPAVMISSYNSIDLGPEDAWPVIQTSMLGRLPVSRQLQADLASWGHPRFLEYRLNYLHDLSPDEIGTATGIELCDQVRGYLSGKSFPKLLLPRLEQLLE